MAQQKSSRAVFDSLLAKTHVQHALIQPDGRHNEIPGVSQVPVGMALPPLARWVGSHCPTTNTRCCAQALAALLFLCATPDRLEAAYASMKDDLLPWEPSPRSIADEETKERFLGDARHVPPIPPTLFRPPLTNPPLDSNAPT